MNRSLAFTLAAFVLCALPAVAAPAKHRTAMRKTERDLHYTLNQAILVSRQGNARQVLYAMKRGESVNERDKDGTTPLMWAAISNWPQLTRLLIQIGANVAAENKDGMNALDYAKKPEEIAVLLNAGAKGSKSDLDATADSLETDDVTSLKYVDGYVNNNSKATYDYVEVDVVFFDDAGDQIDSGMDNTQHLAAGGTWKFKVNSLRDGVASYKIVKVKGD